MERIADIFGIATLGILSWQDFRSRRISGGLLFVLALAFFLSALQKNAAREIGVGFSMNIIFLCVQLLFAWIWFSLKQRRLSKIIDTQIGLGDVLFIGCIAVAFSPANFVLFYITAMTGTLVVTICIRLFRSVNNVEIPLAGALALPLIALCVWKLVDPSMNFYNDEWLTLFFETGFIPAP